MFTVSALALSACAPTPTINAIPATPYRPTSTTGAGAAPPRTAQPTTTTTTTPAVYDNQSPEHPRTGPADPEVGARYPFDLLSHCGARFARFGGREWHAVEPSADPNDDMRIGSVNYLPGIMELTAANRLRFTVDRGSRELPGAVMTFEPTRQEIPLCQ